MLRISIFLAVSSVCAQQKPLFEVEANEMAIPNGIELTYTLVNNCGHPITGVEILTHELPDNGSTGVKVEKLPKRTGLSANRIPLPGAASFTSSKANYKPAYKIQIDSVTFADGSTWHGPLCPANPSID